MKKGGSAPARADVGRGCQLGGLTVVPDVTVVGEAVSDESQLALERVSEDRAVRQVSGCGWELGDRADFLVELIIMGREAID